MLCHTLVRWAVSPEANCIDTVATSSMPGCPEKFDVRPVTVSTSPKQKRRMSTSWMECSIRHPPPAWVTSARHFEPPYLPWIGKYWSSRKTAAMGRPSSPDRTRSRRARNTGADRSTRPAWAGTPASVTTSVRARAPARSVANGFSQKTARPAVAAASTAWPWAEVGVQTQTASQPSITAATLSTVVAPQAAANLSARF